MSSFFSSFGTVQILTVVFLLQLLVLYSIVTGRIVRIAKLLFALPFLAMIFFLFISPPSSLNTALKKGNPDPLTDVAPVTDSAENGQNGKESKNLTTVTSVRSPSDRTKTNSKKKWSENDPTSTPTLEDRLVGSISAPNEETKITQRTVPGDPTIDAAFRNLSSGEGKTVYSPVSVENPMNRAHFQTASAPTDAIGPHASGSDEVTIDSKRPTPVPLRPLSSDVTDAGSTASGGAARSLGGGEFAGPANPLAGGIAVSPGSQSTLVPSGDGIRTADFADSGSPSDIVPAGFRAGPEPPNIGNLSALNIPSANIATPDKIDLSPANSRLLLDYLSNTIREGVESTRPAVVHIEAKVQKQGVGGARESEETGSGVIVKTRNGDFYVITNNHVAGTAVSNESVKIFLADGRVLHPKKILPCSEFDIALLKLPAVGNLHAAPLGDSDRALVADFVLAIGSPFGLEGSVTRGIISGRERRRIPLGNRNQIQDFLQTDASINPGNSGGPLLNVHGRVIGIVTAIASNSGGSEGVGFAIPINNVKYVAAQLIQNGTYRRPYIGIELDKKFSAERKANIGLTRIALDPNVGEADREKLVGTRILGIKSGSPADQAGLREGDIVLRFNGHFVEDEEHFYHLIGLSGVDDRPVLDILRGTSHLRFQPRLIAADSLTESTVRTAAVTP